MTSCDANRRQEVREHDEPAEGEPHGSVVQQQRQAEQQYSANDEQPLGSSITSARHRHTVPGSVTSASVADRGSIRPVRRALAYFGLDGSGTRQDWVRAAVEAAPPLVMATVAAELDGVEGVESYGLWLVYGVVAWTAWLALVVRFAPWLRK